MVVLAISGDERSAGDDVRVLVPATPPPTHRHEESSAAEQLTRALEGKAANHAVVSGRVYCVCDISCNDWIISQPASLFRTLCGCCPLSHLTHFLRQQSRAREPRMVPPLNTLRTVDYHDDDDDDDLLVPQTPSLSSLGSENELFDLDQTTMVCV